MNRRHVFLLLAGLATAASVAFVALTPEDGENGTVEAIHKSPIASRGTDARAERVALVDPLVERAKLMGTSEFDGEEDMFAAKSWASPTIALPPLPSVSTDASDMPFKYIGKMSTPNGWKVFLSKDDATFVVSAGDVVLNDYRVDSIAPPTLTITNLPRHLVQTLQID